MSQQPLHTPPGLNYHCIQCGLSCGMYDEIYVDEATQERLPGLDLSGLLPEEVADQDYLLPGVSRPEKKIMRKHCGKCVFLQEGKLCGIHGRHGYDAKPIVCRTFPYRYVDTPEGVYAGLSFACTAVLANEGPPVASQVDEMRASPAFNGKRLDATRTPHLTNRHQVSAQAAAMIEQDLNEIIRDRTQPFAIRLCAQSVYIDILAKFFREMRGDSAMRGKTKPPPGGMNAYPPDHGPATDAEIITAFRKRYLAEGRRSELYRLAGALRPSPALQRAFIGLMTAFRQNLKVERKQAGRISTIFSIIRHYSAHALKLGSVDLLPLERRFPYSAFEKIPFDADADAEVLELLERYFAHMLFRKDLLIAESIWLGQRMMLMHFALIRWHAVGRTALDGGDRVTLQAVREAVRAVENHYLFHTRMSDLFRKFPLLGIILDAIFSKPLYTPSMTGPPV